MLTEWQQQQTDGRSNTYRAPYVRRKRLTETQTKWEKSKVRYCAWINVTFCVLVVIYSLSLSHILHTIHFYDPHTLTLHSHIWKAWKARKIESERGMNKARIYYTHNHMWSVKVCVFVRFRVCCVCLAGSIVRRPLSYQLKLNSNTSNNNNRERKNDWKRRLPLSLCFVVVFHRPFFPFALQQTNTRTQQPEIVVKRTKKTPTTTKQEANERKKNKIKYVYSIAIKTNFLFLSIYT